MDDLFEEYLSYSSAIGSPARPHDQHDERHNVELCLEYHKLLVLWSLIYPTPDLSQEARQRSSRLQEFLKNLSWLGDFDKAGKTATSIAIEDNQGKPFYWVAANGGVKGGVIDHLTEVLKGLETVHASSPSNQSTIENDIAQKSVLFAKRKVRNYRDRLTKRVQGILEKDRSMHDQFIKEVLTEWQTPPRDEVEICMLARDSARRPEFRHFKRACRHPSPLFWVHHYVEKLGSWHKVAKTLVAIAISKPWLIHQFGIAPITDIRKISMERRARSLEDLIQEIMPRMNPAEVIRTFDERRVNAVTNLSTEYRERLQSSAEHAQAHAECIIAEQFHALDLRFFGDERYIGSSKPPCYSCDRYLRAHPGNFTTRPTHGNAWPNWSIPVTDVTADSARVTHVAATLRSMIRAVVEDIMQQYRNPRVFIGRPPDSMARATSTMVTST